MKTCRVCGEDKPLDGGFYAHKMMRDGLTSECRECVIARTRQWALDNRDKTVVAARRKNLWKKYRLAAHDFDAMFVRQAGLCLVCEHPLTLGGGTAVDHDHSCCPSTPACGACVRGLLCRVCNSGIGLLKDSPLLLERAIEYLAA